VLRSEVSNKIKYDLCIIGSGPAGMTAAIYGARAGRSVAVLAGTAPLGQLSYTTWVENFPGLLEITGPELMSNMKKQVEALGVAIIYEQVLSIELGQDKFVLQTQDDTYIAKTCILATGSSPKWLALDSETKYRGYGVSSCATCDGHFYKGKPVSVVGGGNSAVEEAIYLSSLASKVTLIHRRDSLRADSILQKRLLEKPNVEILWDSEVQEVLGTDDGDAKQVTGLMLYNKKTQEVKELSTSALFVAIGHNPQTDLVKDLLELKDGYVKSRLITKISGLFVAGDVSDAVYRQAVTAAGDGCKAALEAVKFLDSKALSGVQVIKKQESSDGRRSGDFNDRPFNSEGRRSFGESRGRSFDGFGARREGFGGRSGGGFRTDRDSNRGDYSGRSGDFRGDRPPRTDSGRGGDFRSSGPREFSGPRDFSDRPPRSDFSGSRDFSGGRTGEFRSSDRSPGGFRSGGARGGFKKGGRSKEGFGGGGFGKKRRFP